MTRPMSAHRLTSKQRMPEAGWLLEARGSRPPEYLAIPMDRGAVVGVTWTRESAMALRFARQSDAEAIASLHPELTVRATYHEWS